MYEVSGAGRNAGAALPRARRQNKPVDPPVSAERPGLYRHFQVPYLVMGPDLLTFLTFAGI